MCEGVGCILYRLVNVMVYIKSLCLYLDGINVHKHSLLVYSLL